MAQVAKPRKRARQQVTEIEKSDFVNATGDYNIWYHKRLGDRPEKRTEPATTRCDPEKDSGLTKADSSPGRHYFCIYFARGKCVHGHKCQFYHRIPTEEDEKTLAITQDIFGRERHAYRYSTDRDDMGGVGNFNRDNRTLYVGGLISTRSNLEESLYREFGKYGDVEYIRIIGSRMIAFVRFRIRTQAEFAKEAMADQSIAKGEILNIRWSHEDPNPTAQRYEEHELTRRAAEKITEKSKEIGVPDYMVDSHQAIEQRQHPYAKILIGEKKADSDEPAELTAQQQYFLQWAQFFAQQGIDPSQLDEQTIQYYQQYYSSYFYGQGAYGAAPVANQGVAAPAPPPALLEATGGTAATENKEEKTDETNSEETKASE